MLQFLSPIFLAISVAGASLPIIIHLLNRRQTHRFIFGTIRFIQKSIYSNEKRHRLKELLLLLLRALILCCLGVGLPGLTLSQYLYYKSIWSTTKSHTPVGQRPGEFMKYYPQPQHILHFSPNRFICRGSGGFDRGPVLAPHCRHGRVPPISCCKYAVKSDVTFKNIS